MRWRSVIAAVAGLFMLDAVSFVNRRELRLRTPGMIAFTGGPVQGMGSPAEPLAQ